VNTLSRTINNDLADIYDDLHHDTGVLIEIFCNKSFYEKSGLIEFKEKYNSHNLVIYPDTLIKKVMYRITVRNLGLEYEYTQVTGNSKNLDLDLPSDYSDVEETLPDFNVYGKINLSAKPLLENEKTLEYLSEEPLDYLLLRSFIVEKPHD